MDSKKVGALIGQLRKDLGYTQTSLAQILNVSNRTVSKWENGDGYPDITILPELASALNVTVDELLQGERQEKEEREQAKASKTFGDSKLWFILSFFFGVFGSFLGVITEIYCTWAFKILFYTHWEIMFDAISLFSIIASIILFIIGVYKSVNELNVESFKQYCRDNISKFLICFAFWFSFPFSFLVRISYLPQINNYFTFGNSGMYFLIISVVLYIIVNVSIYKKYK